MMDSELSWKYQIEKVTNKLRSITHILRQIKKSTPLKIRLLLYKGLFLPHIEYGLPIYGHTNTEKIHRLQKKAIRIVNNAPISSHTEKMFFEAQTLKVHDLQSYKFWKTKLNMKALNI